ncbi:MAG: AraC family transcriptional regulator [Bacteroidota bacterium]
MDDYNFSVSIKLGKRSLKLPLFSLSNKLKKAFKEEIELRDGLKLIITEYKPKKNISVDFSIEQAPLEFAFCLSGSMSVEIFSANNFCNFLEISAGTCAIFYLPNSKGKLFLNGKDKILVLSLHTSVDYFKQFIESEIENFPENMKELIFPKSGNPFVITSKINPSMKIACIQITDNYSTVPRKMFLEAKSLELMTLLINQISEKFQVASSHISDADLEKARFVEKIILENIADVPPLAELCRIADITHTRLNKAFKQEFGLTVFDYLRNKRLEIAKQMLENGNNVTDISYELGYSSPAHLSREFSKKYGISPKKYQKMAKN